MSVVQGKTGFMNLPNEKKGENARVPQKRNGPRKGAPTVGGPESSGLVERPK